MKVVITAIGTNHYFALARQMYRFGALSAIFTGYPRFKLRHEGIPDQAIQSFPWLQTLYMAQGRLPGGVPWIDRELCFWANRTLDHYVARHLPECDVFVGMSNCGYEAGLIAKQRGSLYVCDRPCSHIRYQDRLLRQEHERRGVSYAGIDPRIIQREEMEYEAADAITVGSTFARNSFLEMGMDPSKVHCVPYGAEASRFQKVGEPEEGAFDVLYVGQITLRKGVHYLLEAFANVRHPHKRLTLVGAIGNGMAAEVAAATGKAVQVLGPMPQHLLKERMSRSHVLVLPSVEDGFGMVMAEAMACGCPIIASFNTGGPDLINDGEHGFLVPAANSEDLRNALQRIADDPSVQRRMADNALARAKDLGGWDTYGDRFYRLLSTLTDSRDLRS